MATIGTFLYTLFKGRPIGTDQFGNRYFEARSERTANGYKKRWVLYEGAAEPTKVPPSWHGWLHYSTDILPDEKSSSPHVWSKEPLPNLTGTPLAYLPPGHVNRGGERAATVGDYQAWKP